MAGRLSKFRANKLTETQTNDWAYPARVKKEEEIEELLEIAKESGVEVPKEKDKTSLLNKLFGFLSAAETAPTVYAMQEGKSLKEALKEQAKVSASRASMKGLGDAPTYEDVLEKAGMKEDAFGTKALGLAGDILLDPTTYVGGSIAKGLGRGASKVTKVGGKGAAKVLKKVAPESAPRIIRGATKIGHGVEDLFSATRKFERIGDTGKKFSGEYQKFLKGTRDQQRQAVKKWLDLRKQGVELSDDVNEQMLKFLEEGGKDVGKYLYHTTPSKNISSISKEGLTPNKIGNRIYYGLDEVGTRGSWEKPDGVMLRIKSSASNATDAYGDKKVFESVGQTISPKDIEIKVGDTWRPLSNVSEGVDVIGETIQGWFKEIAGKEKARGLLDNEIPDYLYHSTTKEAREAGVDYMGTLNNALKARKGKARTIEGTLKDINKWSLENHGFKMFEEDVFKAGALREIKSVSDIRTYDFLKQVESEFGKKGTKTAMIDGVKYVPFKPDIPGGKEFMLPEVIAKELKGVNKVLGNDEAVNSMLKMYDKTMSLWKRSVTSIFPAFHGRNAMGGMFNNFIAGVKNPARYIDGDKFAKGADEVISGIKVGGDKVTYKDLRAMADKLGATGDQGFMDIYRKGAETMGKEGLSKKAMDAVEYRLRGTLMIDRMKKGDSIEEAVKQVWKYHFDYAPEALAPFEREVMRRVIPFYRWTRGNIPLQLEQMALQPGKYAGIGKTMRTISGDKDTSHLPDYMKKSMPIKVGEGEGVEEYLYGMGLPIEDVNKLTKPTDLFAMMAPPIKGPIEQAANINFYFNTPLENVNWAPKGFEKLPEPVKKLVDFEPRGEGRRGTVNPKKWHVITSMLGRGIFTADKLLDPNISPQIKILYGLFGIKGKDIDVETEKYYRTKESHEELKKFLLGKGAIYEGSYTGKVKK